NLSITSKTFDSEVPPLKTNCSLNSGCANNTASVHETQKSFSTITADMLRLAATSRITVARSSGVRLKNSNFMIQFQPVDEKTDASTLEQAEGPLSIAYAPERATCVSGAPCAWS